MLIGLVLSLILLFLRQLYMWKDNQALILTYEQLTTQLEDEVEEGAFALSKSEQRYKSLFEDHLIRHLCLLLRSGKLFSATLH